ncbi:hypothetical protein PFISCL1PPCAC_1171, partial [Pristionchus fissidentatus]
TSLIHPFSPFLMAFSPDDLFIPLPVSTNATTPILKWILSRDNTHHFPLHLLTTGRSFDVANEEIVNEEQSFDAGCDLMEESENEETEYSSDEYISTEEEEEGLISHYCSMTECCKTKQEPHDDNENETSNRIDRSEGEQSAIDVSSVSQISCQSTEIDVVGVDVKEIKKECDDYDLPPVLPSNFQLKKEEPDEESEQIQTGSVPSHSLVSSHLPPTPSSPTVASVLGLSTAVKRRLALTHPQREVVNAIFAHVQYLTKTEQSILASAFNITNMQVRNMFMNRGGRASMRSRHVDTNDVQRVIRESLQHFGFSVVPVKNK